MNTRTTKPPQSRGKIRTILLFVAGVILILGAHWAWSAMQRKPSAQREVEKALSSISLPDKAPVYSASRDNGCFTNDTGWFGTSTACAYAGEEFYKGKGQLAEDLQKADQAIMALGWQRHSALPTDEDLHRADAQGGSAVWISYSDPSKNLPSLTLTYFSNHTKPGSSQYTPHAELLKIQQANTLADDEYLYGVSAYFNY